VTCSRHAWPKRDVVLLNAAAALVVAGKAENLRDGVRLAAAAIDDGRERALVERVREALA
jgi:anthranilate phosphoribosyltransferase